MRSQLDLIGLPYVSSCHRVQDRPVYPTCRSMPSTSASKVTRQRGLPRRSSCMVIQVSSGRENYFGRSRTMASSRRAIAA